MYKTEAGEIIIRDGQDIFIPKNHRQKLIEELHSTHLSDVSMINLAKGHAYWPTIKEDLRTRYKACNECLTNAISKPSPHYEVTPASLELLQPNEVVHVDFMQIGTINIFILKCKSSGWIWGRITNDKTSETARKIFHKYITSYNRPHLVVLDEGSAFSSIFLDFLHSHRISHRFSSACQAQSNSPAERGVRSIKDVLNKIPSFTDKTLRTVIFNVNQHVAPDGSGSPAERFFKRRIRTGLPTIIENKSNMKIS